MTSYTSHVDVDGGSDSLLSVDSASDFIHRFGTRTRHPSLHTKNVPKVSFLKLSIYMPQQTTMSTFILFLIRMAAHHLLPVFYIHINLDESGLYAVRELVRNMSVRVSAGIWVVAKEKKNSKKTRKKEIVESPEFLLHAF